MSTPYPWNYDQQIEGYVTQFLRIFSGIQVRDGVQRNGSYNYRQPPVMFGDPTRIVSSVITKRRSFTNPVVPLMAGHIRSIEMDQESRGPQKYHEDVVSYQDATTGDFKTLKRLLGPPLTLQMQLSIYASSNDELLQILEQILLIFNPRVTIQRSEDITDFNYLTQIELTQIEDNIQSPLSTEEKVFLTSLSFTMPIRLNYPHTESSGVIKQIVQNMYDDTIEIIKIDDQTIVSNNYERVVDASTMTITGFAPTVITG